MTPEQLEAHRVRFEQQSGEPEAMKGQRRGDGYANHSDTRTWQAYQCGIADADRAQRAAPGVQASYSSSAREVIEMLIACHEEPTCPAIDVARQFLCDTAQQTPPAQPPQQSAQPSMQDALAAGDGTLHGAIDYWQAKCAELEAKLAQSAQPLADGCVFFVDPEIIRWTLAGSPRAKTQLWLAKTARPEDGLTMPLYAAAQSVEVQPESVIVPRSLEAAKLMVLLGTNWLTAHAPGELKVAPVEVHPLTRTEVDALVYQCRQSGDDSTYALAAAIVAKQGGIKPTSSEGGA